MTPEDIHHYVQYLYTITDNLTRISDHIWGKIRESQLTGHGFHGQDVQMMTYFKDYTSKEQIFMKLIDFHTGVDRTFKFSRRPFE